MSSCFEKKKKKATDFASPKRWPLGHTYLCSICLAWELSPNNVSQGGDLAINGPENYIKVVSI